MNTTLERATFETNRALEYFSEKELTAQIGFERDLWPLAILRELIDNSLDAAESVAAPEITVSTLDDQIVVADNGPGIPATIIERSLDYLVRVSNKAYYVSPTRGQMGNALKVVWAAPFVSTGGGIIEVISQGRHHRIEVELDRIAQAPRLTHTSVPTDVNSGTVVKIAWTDSTRLLHRAPGKIYNNSQTAPELVAAFAVFNPHATFILDGTRHERTVTDWSKWRPDQPTSAHWYTDETLRDLIAAYINRERHGGPARTVREFVSEFRGLSSTVKQKTVTESWAGKRLHEFISGGDIDPGFVAELLTRMKANSTPPPPKALGRIGEDHLKAWILAQGVAENSIHYATKAAIDGLPYVVEVAFGVNVGDNSGRRIVAGLNWSPVIGGDPDPTLRSAITEARLDPHDPVTFVVHISRPRFHFTDRGKTRVQL